MTWENSVALLGACSVLVVALLKWKPGNGNGTYVSKEVCSLNVGNINRRLDELVTALREVNTTLVKLMEAHK